MKNGIYISTKYKLTIVTCLVLTTLLLSWAEETNAATISYTYDTLNRVTKVVYDNGSVEEHTYDAAGNRLSLTITEIDSDGDGLPDSLETTICTDPNDADTDNDGIMDGAEDLNHDGIVDLNETNPCYFDTDEDGIQDGTEKGVTLNDIGSDTDTNFFQPDLDPSTTTNPLLEDTDGDGFTDGQEDGNANGRVDAGEKDPNTRNVTAMPWIPLLLWD